VRGIGSLIGSAAIEATVTGKFVTDGLRQEAIRFQGVQQKLHQFLAVLFGLVRWGLIIGIVVLIYDFVHQHNFNLVAGFHDDLGAFGDIVEKIAPYPAEFGLTFIFLVLLFIIITGRLKNRFNQATIRLPDGRLDT
jgi:hypothetical protein